MSDNTKKECFCNEFLFTLYFLNNAIANTFLFSVDKCSSSMTTGEILR
jgi:hypothetical protein